ncbi:hypothetical protein [Anaeromyxobacter oryzae]|uniref:Uncharacterized protein n=1 Tax=Anaeromyxobacter oryzae TaxID=2918170 RepID=A0ABM7WWW7_9BACT|nr:hypothetical protein [Anaeromyxobacter oryzae]BDG03964.1 hypothetical protein AMOR_29600 [Anaeromyxobacter oryzae]
MRRLALVLAVALALPAAAQDALPPPPPPPSDDVPLPPPPTGTTRLPASSDMPAGRTMPPYVPGRTERPASFGLTPVPIVRRAGTIGDGPVAFAGDAGAPLHPDEAYSHWRMSLASGVLGRFGGHQISDRRENPSTLIYLGGQADGLWTEGYGQSVRLRAKLMTGGEDEIFIPSDGEVEAAYMIGRPEFRFVIGRVEVARYPGLALQVLGQLATLPSVEGSIPLAGDRMRLYYYVSPVEMAYAYYYGDAHIRKVDPAPSETDGPAAATAGRLRYTTLLPPAVLFSLEGDVLKMWKKNDLMLSGEGSLGYSVLDGSVMFNVAVRWTSYTRRDRSAVDATANASDLKLMAVATLAF